MKKQDSKIYEAQRCVITLEAVDWSELIDARHPARRIVRVLDGFDLTELYEKITSEKSCKGRPAIDPKIMLSVLVYAAMIGITSSRSIAAHCKWEPGFRWILGYDLSVGYVTISNFRKEAGTCLDNMLTQVITAMVASGVVDLGEVILDGTKIKANAGRGSFHTTQELQDLHKEISDKLEKMSVEPKTNQKAKLKDQQSRVEKALEQIPDIQQALNESAKKRKKGTKRAIVKEARASSTDASARQMHFADGSKAPGYNCQFMTSPKSGVIVDVKTTQRRNDSNMITPMLDSFKSRYGRFPERLLGDVGYTVAGDIVTALERRVDVYCPQKKASKGSKNESQRRLEIRRSKEPEALQEWRARMDTAEAKVIRRRRSQTEKVHGWIKSKLPHCQLKLRGVEKVQIEVLLFAIGYNLKRYFNMSPAFAI